MKTPRVGIIGGSGLYDLPNFTNQKWVTVNTPFGKPSDQYLTGTLNGRDVVFLPRHGRAHAIMPNELNHRANIWGMKKLGVEWIIAVSAVGSLQEALQPGHLVLPDQFLDRTKQPNHTFFGEGIVGHIPFANPISSDLSYILDKAYREGVNTKQIPETVKLHRGGTYVNMEGPAFSTYAESTQNHQAGHSVIGMTCLGEAKCSREAEIAYAVISIITDYDCWKPEEGHVTVDMVYENLKRSIGYAKIILADAVQGIPTEPDRKWTCHSALKNAIMTKREAWPKATIQKLQPILYKYL
jgi:5'-methylthioadenosine phosphorylase